MKQINRKAYYAKPADYRGTWSSPETPELIGRKTFLALDEKTGGTVLEIEGVSFELTN